MTIVAITANRKTISIMKAGELVDVSRRTIYNWMASGKVEYVRTAGGSVRIFVDTLWQTAGTAEKPIKLNLPGPVTPTATQYRSGRPSPRTATR